MTVNHRRRLAHVWFLIAREIGHLRLAFCVMSSAKRSLIQCKQSSTELVGLFNLSKCTPSISCHGPLVRIRRLAVRTQ